MYKTITIRVSKEELQQIDKLREKHLALFKVPINQFQLIRNLIHEKYINEFEFKNKAEINEEIDDVFLEKEQAHKRDMNILDRIKDRRWGKMR